MNLKDLIAKMTAIEEGTMPPVAPVHTDGAGAGDSYDNDMEECGMPMPIAIGGGMGPQHEQDHVSMNVSLNGSGTGGVRDLMSILRDIENSAEHEPQHHEPEEPLMGDMVRAMSHEEDMGEEYENSVHGHDGATQFGIDAVTFAGDDLASKGKGALKHNGGENPMHESLVNRLTQMYQAIKEDDNKPPFDGPYTKAGEHKKDQFGNTIKHVAKHLAKKGMKQATGIGKDKKDTEKMDESVSQMLALNKRLNG
jgi:hypothetical protein